MQVDPIAVVVQIHRHLVTGMALRPVADHVDLLIPPQSRAEIVQVRQEQLRVAALLGLALGEEDLAGPPVDRTGDVPLLVVAGRLHLGLLPPDHPHRSDLGIGVDVHLVLEDGRLVVGQLGQELPQGSQPLLSLLIGRPEDGTGPAIDQVGPVQPAADGLATDLDPMEPTQHNGNDLAAPTTSREAELARCLLGDPLGGELDPGWVKARPAAGLVASDRLDALGVESLDPAVDGAAAAIQERGNSDPGVALAQQQEDRRAESDVGVGRSAVEIEEAGALLGSQVEAAFHRGARRKPEVRTHLVLRCSTLSGLQGAI